MEKGARDDEAAVPRAGRQVGHDRARRRRPRRRRRSWASAVLHPRRPGLRHPDPDAPAPLPLRRGRRAADSDDRRPSRTATRRTPATLHGPADLAPSSATGCSATSSRASRKARPLALGGGSRPAQLDKGFFVEPTLFADVDNSMTIAQEEIFGPVLVVIPFDDDDDAVRIANDSPYGLAGRCSPARTERSMARRPPHPRRHASASTAAPPTADLPFGGYKDSGVGRQNGIAGFDQYLETKSIAWPASMTTDRAPSLVLRPVRLRDRRRPVPGLAAAARRGAALLQRAVRLLRAEPLRRRRARPRRLEDLQLGARARSSSSSRPTSRCRRASIIFEDPPEPRPAPRPAVAGVHAQEDERHRAQGPRVLRPQPRPARRRRRLRLHRRPRRPDADAHDRHAARHPRAGPGGDPRPDRRGPRASSDGEHARRADVDARRPGERVRRLRRLAGRAPVRRPHDRAAPGRVRGRDRRRRAGSPATRSSTTSTCSPAPATRPPPGSSAGRARCSPSTPTSAREIVEDRSLVPNAIEELLRYEAPSPVQARYVTARRRAPRPDRARGQRHRAAQRLGQPRRPPVPRRRPLRHPPQDRPPPRVRLRHPLLPRRRARPASRAASRSTRCSSASPSGRSTGTTPCRPAPRRSAAGSSLPVTRPAEP